MSSSTEAFGVAPAAAALAFASALIKYISAKRIKGKSSSLDAERKYFCTRLMSPTLLMEASALVSPSAAEAAKRAANSSLTWNFCPLVVGSLDTEREFWSLLEKSNTKIISPLAELLNSSEKSRTNSYSPEAITSLALRAALA